MEISQRQQAEEAIRQLNEGLELRVVERTQQVESANRELEAFSYSVSHDLRAPLRAINGFSNMLLEDHAAQLDKQGQLLLEKVQTAGQRMGHLIDDLLKLSRLMRGEMHRQEINLTILVHEVVASLQQGQPERQVELVIQEEMMAYADAGLLRVVLENLLHNARKFTGRQESPRIEVGALPRADGRTAYFIRDNGAGFDMRYAGKLFGAFQRLHTETEFPGTGIGLATVQRIIHRHGGRVWAEAAVGQGATFYFTLG
jgi:light-regulated signal transduction histidine kinase (bacteriophytochrome)